MPQHRAPRSRALTLTHAHRLLAAIAAFVLTLALGIAPGALFGASQAQAAPAPAAAAPAAAAPAAAPAAAAPAFAAAPAAAPVLPQAASPDGRISLTKTPSVSALPVGGGTVTYTYVVRNTTNEEMFYTAVTDNRCTNRSAITGMYSYYGAYYLSPGRTATWTCTQTLTATTTNTASATFETYNQKFGGAAGSSTATATATVTVATESSGNTSCDNLYYSSYDPADGTGGRIGRALPDTTLGIAIPSLAGPNSGATYNDSTGLAIDPRDPNRAYVTVRASEGEYSNRLYSVNLATNAFTEIPAARQSAAWQTNRLAVAPDGTVWSWDRTGVLWSWKPGTTSPVNHGVPAKPSNAPFSSSMAALSSGDIVFDGAGTMWLLAADASSVQSHLMTIGAGELADTDTIQTTYVGAMDAATSGGARLYFNGLAFTTDGTLYASSSTGSGSSMTSYLYTVNKDNGDVALRPRQGTSPSSATSRPAPCPRLSSR